VHVTQFLCLRRCNFRAGEWQPAIAGELWRQAGVVVPGGRGGDRIALALHAAGGWAAGLKWRLAQQQKSDLLHSQAQPQEQQQKQDSSEHDALQKQQQKQLGAHGQGAALQQAVDGLSSGAACVLSAFPAALPAWAVKAPCSEVSEHISIHPYRISILTCSKQLHQAVRVCLRGGR
jgi:hypothetical protein